MKTDIYLKYLTKGINESLVVGSANPELKSDINDGQDVKPENAIQANKDEIDDLVSSGQINRYEVPEWLKSRLTINADTSKVDEMLGKNGYPCVVKEDNEQMKSLMDKYLMENESMDLKQLLEEEIEKALADDEKETEDTEKKDEEGEKGEEEKDEEKSSSVAEAFFALMEEDEEAAKEDDDKEETEDDDKDEESDEEKKDNPVAEAFYSLYEELEGTDEELTEAEALQAICAEAVNEAIVGTNKLLNTFNESEVPDFVVEDLFTIESENQYSALVNAMALSIYNEDESVLEAVIDYIQEENDGKQSRLKKVAKVAAGVAGVVGAGVLAHKAGKKFSPSYAEASGKRIAASREFINRQRNKVDKLIRRNPEATATRVVKQNTGKAPVTNVYVPQM